MCICTPCSTCSELHDKYLISYRHSYNLLKRARAVFANAATAIIRRNSVITTEKVNNNNNILG